MPASGSESSSGSCNGNGCCQDCRCCKQAYEHLPVPRLRHQQPPPPLYHSPQQHPQQQQQQVSCITTLQQTTTTQQLQQIPAATSANYCLMPTTTTSNTYVSNVKPEQLMQHCHSHCDGHSGNMQPFASSNISRIAPAVYQSSPAQSMIFVPFMLPQQSHLQLQPPLPPPPEDCKPLLQAKGVPPRRSRRPCSATSSPCCSHRCHRRLWPAPCQPEHLSRPCHSQRAAVLGASNPQLRQPSTFISG